MKSLRLTSLSLITALSLSVAAHAHTIEAPVEKMRVLPVSATAFISAAPDKAVISAGVLTTGRDAAQTASQNAETMSAVHAALSAAGIERSNIKTSRLSLQPSYDYSNRKKPKITGYTSNNTVSVTVYDLDKVGVTISALTDAGANRISNIQFSLRDSEALEAVVLDQAIAKARKKASAIAGSAGVTLGQLQSLKINDTGYRPYNYRQDEIVVTGTFSSSAPAPVVAPISAAEQTIKATVHLVYEMR